MAIAAEQAVAVSQVEDLETRFGLDFSTPLGGVQKCIFEGNVEEIEEAVKRALQHHSPTEIIRAGLIKAMQIIGILWEEGVYFLPETLMAAEAMERAMRLCEARLEKSPAKKGVVVTHTAEGDIHDLGQQLANMLLRVHGYEVIDLGKDVPVSKVVEAVERFKPLMLTGTALMSTTAPAFRQIARRLLMRGIELPFICGGGAVTQQYAHSFDLGIHGTDVFQAPQMAEEAASGKGWRQLRERFNEMGN